MPNIILNEKAMVPMAIPKRMALLAPVVGTLNIQTIVSGIPCHIICPKGICPSIIIKAERSKSVASMLLALNALNAAEAIKNPINENMVAINGDMAFKNIQNKGEPSLSPVMSGKNPSHLTGSASFGTSLNHKIIEGRNPAAIARKKAEPFNRRSIFRNILKP